MSKNASPQRSRPSETIHFRSEAKKLSGVPDTWRIRIGDYRVIYQVHRGILLVLVLTVGHRREVYRN